MNIGVSCAALVIWKNWPSKGRNGMRDHRPDEPLARRVPGASNAGPALPAAQPLPQALVDRLRAAVAAHAAMADSSEDSDRVAEPAPGARPGDAPCDLIPHEADEPGSLWEPAAGRPATPDAQATAAEVTARPAAGRCRPPVAFRIRPAFPLFRSWQLGCVP